MGWSFANFTPILDLSLGIIATTIKGLQRDCPSGQLSKKKFIEVYSGFFPDGNAEEFCTHVFRTFDKDNSGRIDFKEFLLAINITSGGDPEEKLEWAYQMYDIDGNGTIERTEMVEIIRVSYLIQDIPQITHAVIFVYVST
ncbi:putative neuronal calcium sensor [Fasciola gigantica]|uniref:Putative neuronal calcium sensor n=1 Tax=Fasciola gigantica TaxID=46835 RepID=A0A504YP54_FASGI|nr:putative neuronal calcium sensor [Fasciola gigantica]